MEPPSAQSPFAQWRHYPPLGRRVRRLLRGHYSSVIAPADSFANPVWLFFPSALASCKKSSQVATSPCCHRDLPDVISADLSPDAWPPTTAVPRGAYTCFFFRVIGLPPERSGSASRFFPRIRLLAGGVFEAADISLCSGLRVCSSPRSFLPLHNVPQGSRDFYIRAERASLPLHAPDMLAVRIQALHRRLRRLCYLHRRSDCYRVERSSSRAGLSPTVVQCLSRRTVNAWLRQLSIHYCCKFPINKYIHSECASLGNC